MSQPELPSGERQPEYPFTAWELEVERALKKVRGRPRHAGLNALRGLRRAWLIAPIDPEMAVFRAITAEEEAATALIAALQRRRYPSATKLNPRRHEDKAGWSPFLQTVEKVFAESGVPPLRYRIDADATPPRIDIFIPGAAYGLGNDIVATPDEPLNGFMSEGGEGRPTTVMRFRDQLHRRAVDGGAQNMREFIRAEANLRNRLLYAADSGWPVVKHPDGFLVEKRRPVSLLLSLTIAILQTSMHQLLAVQAVEAYLEALGRMTDENYDFSTAVAPQPEVTIVVKKTGDGPPAVTIERHPKKGG